LTDKNGKALQQCSSEDKGVVACGMITGADFSVKATINGNDVFTLDAKPSNPGTIYRIEVF
jgi:hypothetical protein